MIRHLIFALFYFNYITVLINAHKTQVHTEGGGSSRPISACGQRRIDQLLDFWRGARQVRRGLRRRPVRLCVGYGVGSMQKYKLGFNWA